MQEQLTKLALRLEELETQLAQPETYGDPALLAALTRERKELVPLVETFRQYQAQAREVAELQALLADPECRDLAKEELDPAREKLEQLEEALKARLVPKDPTDDKSVILEIRAGVGARRRPSLPPASTGCTPCTQSARVGGWSWPG